MWLNFKFDWNKQLKQQILMTWHEKGVTVLNFVLMESLWYFEMYLVYILTTYELLHLKLTSKE